MNIKSLCVFTFFATVLFSCKNSEKPKEEAVVSQKKDSLISEVDTFYFGNKLFSIEQITKADFDKVAEYPDVDTSEKNNLLKDSAYVTPLGGTLILNVGKNNSETIVLKDVMHEGYEDNAAYTYLGRLPE